MLAPLLFLGLVAPAIGTPHVMRAVSNGALPDNYEDHEWIPQQPGDRRSPCPGLNTLANHGYLPRDGRNINRTILRSAFLEGWGIDESVLVGPIITAFATCDAVSGGEGECGDSFDLDVLNSPDMFEHDHSISRQDYKMNWKLDGTVDNHVFNRTIFGTALGWLTGKSTMGVKDAEQIRLAREGNAFYLDPIDDFIEAIKPILTEMGFMFAVMRNFNDERYGVAPQEPNTENDQTIQIDWWEYWFVRQQFPTDLGWRKPVPAVKNDYVQAIATSIFNAPTSGIVTPYFLPADATVSIPPKKKRQATATQPSHGRSMMGPDGQMMVPETVSQQAASEVGPTPAPINPYDGVDYSHLTSHVSARSSYKTAFSNKVVSIMHKSKRDLLASATIPAVDARSTS